MPVNEILQSFLHCAYLTMVLRDCEKRILFTQAFVQFPPVFRGPASPSMSLRLGAIPVATDRTDQSKQTPSYPVR